MNIRGQISDMVLHAIQTSGLSRYEISKQSRVPESVLSRFVRGERSISLDTLDKLADVLGIELKVKSTEGQRTERSGRNKS